MPCSLWLLAFAAAGVHAAGWDPFDFPDGSDLTHFITRPEIKAPRLNVTKHIPEAIAEGYMFFTPYSELEDQGKTTRREHIPCQTGAHIYDGDGELVWSGACLFRNRNIHNLKAVKINGTDHLTMFVSHGISGHGVTEDEAKETNIILDNHYQEVDRPQIGGRYAGTNFHEFTILPGGKRAIMTRDFMKTFDSPMHNKSAVPVWSTGFRELDLATGEVLFDWSPTESGVKIDESYDLTGLNASTKATPWDFFHINSVDKNEDGDYLISGRHTFSIYKISGKDGSIIWRLGGRENEFEMLPGSEFHWQHDARFRSQNETHTIISLFDNHGDDASRDPEFKNEISAALFLVLDTASTPMTAKLLRRLTRPDGNKSGKCGNTQMIGKSWDDSHVFVDWAVPAYVSEHDAQDRLVMEARFASSRFNSYRAYKFPFVGEPKEAPAFKVLPMAFGDEGIASAFYVSWNGATEVKSWAIHASDSEDGPFELLNTIPKQGFETSYVVARAFKYSYAEAIDSKGKSLDRSPTFHAEWADNATTTNETLFAPNISASPEETVYVTREITAFATGFAEPVTETVFVTQELPPTATATPKPATETVYVTYEVAAAPAYTALPDSDWEENVEQEESSRTSYNTEKLKELGTSEMLGVFCVSVFALFGLFIALRRGLYMFARWRRGHGYSPVPLSREPSYSDTEKPA